MKGYVVIEIGCVECGDDLKCLGVFATREEAVQACDRDNEDHNPTVIFEVELP